MEIKSDIKCDDVRVTKSPLYNGLIVRNILKCDQTQTDIDKYIPEYDYLKVQNRDWYCKIINTLFKLSFKILFRK